MGDIGENPVGINIMSLADKYKHLIGKSILLKEEAIPSKHRDIPRPVYGQIASIKDVSYTSNKVHISWRIEGCQGCWSGGGLPQRCDGSHLTEKELHENPWFIFINLPLIKPKIKSRFEILNDRTCTKNLA